MIKKKKPSEKEIFENFKKQDPYAGAVLEEMNDKLSIIIERHDILEGKIDHVDAKLEAFRMEVNEKFDAHAKDMKSLRDNKAEKTDVALIDHRVTRLEQKPA